MDAFTVARGRDNLALSEAVFAEITDVLNRPRLVRFVRPELRDRLLAQLATGAHWFTPTEAVAECRDPNDDKYLELAVAAGAETIVSSDRDLLVLDPWRGVRIMRPAAYLALVAKVAPVRPP